MKPIQEGGNKTMPESHSRPKNEGNLAALMAKVEGEPIASFFKFKVLEISPGYAKISLKLLPEYLNFNGVVFGSIYMAAADYAFSLAINSLSLSSVASQFNIYLLAAAEPGEEIFAEGRVLRSGRRIGITEMTVTDQNGKLIARATGTTVPLNNTGG
jgi:acyl-CoA thioesterase